MHRAGAMLGPVVLALLMGAMAFLAGFFGAACGTAPVVAPRILPPNVAQACDRAIACGVFLPEQRPECINCVEKLAEQNADALKGQDLPALDTVACDVVATYAHTTLVSECVVRRSFGP